MQLKPQALNRAIRHVSLFLFPLLAFSAGADEAIREQIRTQIEYISSGTTLEVQGAPVASVIVLPALYRQRDFAPVWTNGTSVEQLFDALHHIHEDGLDATDYHLAELQTLRSSIGASQTPDASLLADFDLLMTDSLIRLGYHLLIGKVDPVELDNNWNMGRNLDGLDSVLALSTAIDEGTIDNLVASLRPQHVTYRRLKAALARYRGLAAAGGWEPVPSGPALKPGMSDERVVALRRRLAVTGEMAADNPDSALFDESVEAGVKAFQRRQGLDADGVVGKATLEALNVPVQGRIDQIRVNLERARWVLHDLPDEFVLVDIAGFTVRYVRDGHRIWEARAQVGKPYRMTPVFKSAIRYLEMNPTWTVPPTILRDDVLPAIKRDSAYLEKKNMRVIDYQGNSIDQAGIDWSRYRGPDFPYMIRQDPGPQNALGRIKFMFPNEHAVYLHDTPSKSLFNRTERAFSSGCIRVEHPYQFAELLLDNPKQWNREALMQAIDTRETRSVSLPRPVTVLLLYWTVATDDDGEVVFKQDIYDRDTPILAGLQSPFGFRKQPVIAE